MFAGSFVLDAPLFILPVPWESSRGQLKVLGSCVCMQDPEEALASWLLASDHFSSGSCGQLGSEPVDERSFSLSLLLSVNLNFQEVNKYF